MQAWTPAATTGVWGVLDGHTGTERVRMDTVAITGIGIVSPLGNSPEEFTSGLQEGRVRIVPAPWADPDGGRHAWISTIEDFDPLRWIDERVVDGTDIFAQYALA